MSARVLVVGGEKDFADKLQIQLQPDQIEVSFAPNGAEALHQLKGTPPDLIVADLPLAVISAHALMAELQTASGSQMAPVLAVCSEEHLAGLHSLAGISDYMAKPVILEELAGRIKWNLKRFAQGDPSGEGPGAERVPKALNKLILIVDDDESLAETMRIRLENEGFTTSVVYDGEEAVERVRQISPDLIVMDVMMPRLDGFSTLKKLNQLTDRKVPVVVLTGTAIVAEDDFRMEGARAFFRKPVDGAQMVKQIKEILRIR